MIRRSIFFVYCFIVMIAARSQTVSDRLAAAYHTFEKDSQLESALSSLYVIDGRTDSIVFQKNAMIGLAPASTQKIITAVTAYELLGSDFQYKTEFGYRQENDNTEATLFILPVGDPTLGSWRWERTKEAAVLKRIIRAVKQTNLKRLNAILLQKKGWSGETIPDGWIWQDIGNYYGAGAAALNWRENQFDLILRSGKKIGDPVIITGTKPKLYDYTIISQVFSAPKGTGDNSYIYFPLTNSIGTIRGTIPIGENKFIVSGAMPSPVGQFIPALGDSLRKAGINLSSTALSADMYHKNLIIDKSKITLLHTEYSPVLDSMVYWLLKKSINLYGEAFIKTLAFQKYGFALTDSGIAVVKRFWKQKGVSSNELNMVDGSGLSPLNRVTTHAQVAILQYAKSEPWFDGFYKALPEYNAMKIKSGTINGVKGFAGYHTSKKGVPYIFSFLVNNYNGSSATLVQKMYRVLDVLK